MCSFNGSQDLQSIDSATRIHIYVFDEIHLLTHGGEYNYQMCLHNAVKYFGKYCNKIFSRI